MEVLNTLYWTAIAIFSTLLIKRILRWRKFKLPPGPIPWPLIGNALQVDYTGIHKTFIEWGKTYGGIFKIRMLTDDIIVINDKELIHEVVIGRSSEFAGRQHFERLSILLDRHPDLVHTSVSPKWSANKKLCMKYLKKFGDVKDGVLEEITHCAIDKMLKRIDEISNQGDGEFDINPVIHICTAEVIGSILYRDRFSEKELRELLKTERLAMDASTLVSPHAYIDAIPFASYLPTKHVKEIFGLARWLRNFFGGKTEEFKKFGDTKNPSCVMEAFLQHQTENPTLTDKDIENIIMNVIFAGFITTSSTSYALLAVVLNYPEIQEKIHEEISQVLKDKKPSLSDRPNMPYIEACILEILRYSSIVSVLVPHATMNDTKLGGYDIPAGTTVMPNVWYLHHNENLWEEPFAFKPERFLDEHGKLVEIDHPNRKNLLAFGAGRRICPGEILARNRLFLILTTLFQNYKFMREKMDSPPECDPRSYEMGIVMIPKAYKVRVEKRKLTK